MAATGPDDSRRVNPKKRGKAVGDHAREQPRKKGRWRKAGGGEKRNKEKKQQAPPLIRVEKEAGRKGQSRKEEQTL